MKPQNNNNDSDIPRDRILVEFLATRITDQQYLLEQELPSLKAAVELIRIFANNAMEKHLQAIVLLGDEAKEEVGGTFDEIYDHAAEVSFKAGYRWAHSTTDQGFLEAIIRFWVDSDDSPEAFTALQALILDRWPEIALNWDSFVAGVCEAFNEATDTLKDKPKEI